MVDPVEFPDFQPKSQLPEKVKALVRSNPEHERNGFSKALKEKLEEELEEENRKKKEDSLELTETNPYEADEEDNNEESEDSSEQAEEREDAQDENAPVEPEVPEHIDLKA